MRLKVRLVRTGGMGRSSAYHVVALHGLLADGEGLHLGGEVVGHGEGGGGTFAHARRTSCGNTRAPRGRGRKWRASTSTGTMHALAGKDRGRAQAGRHEDVRNVCE